MIGDFRMSNAHSDPMWSSSHSLTVMLNFDYWMKISVFSFGNKTKPLGIKRRDIKNCNLDSRKRRRYRTFFSLHVGLIDIDVFIFKLTLRVVIISDK
ncbi:hypothetical protein CEXT_217211 [Caerostris extrusa]|uniref:Uncharacterized protein n=1 Tax=Caerostris extrusa TaxID=172846 RepID=A0AAV4UF60_CAEEX|nr:hypothetical protein CEXT_217211 [Caerostris extrusa]